MRQGRDDFQQRFRKEPPSKQTLSRWKLQLFQTGSVKNRPRTGRPQSRGTQCKAVENAISKSTKKSRRKLSTELGVPRTTLRRHMKVKFKLLRHRPSCVHELSDDDLNRRYDACGRMLQEFRTVSKRRRVIFIGECAIYRSSRTRGTGQALLRNPRGRNASRDGLVKLGWVHCLQYTLNCFQDNVCGLCRCEPSNHH